MASVHSSVDPFQAVADPTRRAILDRLRGGEAAVADIAAQFTMSRPAISRHLRVLRDARLVRERRGGDDGRQRLYQVTPAPLRTVAKWAQAYEEFWTTNLASLKNHLETPRVVRDPAVGRQPRANPDRSKR
jgi:DNA-binding transcriptional ArsR family regulator